MIKHDDCSILTTFLCLLLIGKVDVDWLDLVGSSSCWVVVAVAVAEQDYSCKQVVAVDLYSQKTS